MLAEEPDGGLAAYVARFNKEKQCRRFYEDKFEKTIGLPGSGKYREIPPDMIDNKQPYNPYGIVLPGKLQHQE
ncbi:MAG: hypothetical protein M0C28_20620 [Candidatus Moduliflexus flocculans]|nr:hypothetical protein [Candidatus Moduliflexus flocculans]